MKKLLLITVLFLFIFNLKATHYMGGEITWECIATGQPDAGKFIFTLKVYRECYTTNGNSAAQFGTTETIVSNSPAGNFTVTEVAGYPIDISPVCNSNAAFSHLSCSGMSSGAGNMGAVQLHIYKSTPIQLNAIPFATGWTFSWSGCCRNSSANLVGQASWYLRAKMYPFNGQNTYPCFDNSPEFAENPKPIISAGYPYAMNYLVTDNEEDSISFEWGQPMESATAPVAYSMGYSYQNPLPDTMQNPNNVAAVLDSITGMISLTSYTTGAYNTSVKVSSYRCGVLVSEIWREIQLVIAPPSSNTPPIMVPPFVSGTSWDITVYAGDLVQFSFNAQDFQYLPNSTPQSVELNYYGAQFGSYIPPSGGVAGTLSNSLGCAHPPCAQLTPAPGPNNPLVAMFGVQTQFSWQTTCDHLYPTINCNQGSNVYHFLFTTKDDFCPVPAVNGKIISITVISPTLTAPIVDSVSFDYNSMSANLSWLPVIDPMSIFYAYDIYYSDQYNGTYILIDSVLDINQTTLIYPLSNSQTAYFYIKTRSVHCNHTSISDRSNILGMSLVSIEQSQQNSGLILYQNTPNPSNESTTIRYAVDSRSQVKFQVRDLSGRVLMKRNLTSNAGMNFFEISTAPLPNGVYFYSIEIGLEKAMQKMVILR